MRLEIQRGGQLERVCLFYYRRKMYSSQPLQMLGRAKSGGLLTNACLHMNE
jgi:hypothetical protein